MTNQEPRAKRCSSKGSEGSEGDWNWVLVSAMFISTGLVFGLMRSLGVFFMEFVHYFEVSAQAVSWISSIGLAAQQFFSPLGTALCNAYETRWVVMTGGFLAGLGLILASQATSLLHLYLTMGVISGVGWGLVFTPMMATVTANITIKRRALALGVGLSSVGIFSFTFNPFFQFLVETYTWRGALLILGGLSFNIVACGAIIPPRRRPKSLEKVEHKVDAKGRSSCSTFLKQASTYLELSLLLERPYLTYVAAVTFINFGYFVPYFHLVALSRHAGFSDYQAAFVMSATGVADILARVVSGWFSDLGHFRQIHLLSLWAMLAGAFIMFLPLSSLSGSYVALLVVSLFYGFCAGALTCVCFSVVPMIVGVERVMGAMGLLQLIESSAGLLGTPLSGWLKDVTGNYIASFMVTGSFLILGTLTLATLPHYFSCTDLPTPQRHSPDSTNVTSCSELEERNSTPANTSNGGAL